MSDWHGNQPSDGRTSLEDEDTYSGYSPYAAQRPGYGQAPYNPPSDYQSGGYYEGQSWYGQTAEQVPGQAAGARYDDGYYQGSYSAGGYQDGYQSGYESGYDDTRLVPPAPREPYGDTLPGGDPYGYDPASSAPGYVEGYADPRGAPRLDSPHAGYTDAGPGYASDLGTEVNGQSVGYDTYGEYDAGHRRPFETGHGEQGEDTQFTGTSTLDALGNTGGGAYPYPPAEAPFAPPNHRAAPEFEEFAPPSPAPGHLDEVEVPAAPAVVPRPRPSGAADVETPDSLPALLIAAAGVVVAGAAMVGAAALLVALIALQLVTAVGWSRLLGIWPARRSVALTTLAGVAADVGVVATHPADPLAPVVAALGVAVVVAFLDRVLRPGPLASSASDQSGTEPTVAYGLFAEVVGMLFTVAPALYLSARSREPGVAALAALAAAAGALVWTLLVAWGNPKSGTSGLGVLAAVLVATVGGAGGADATRLAIGLRGGALLGLVLGLLAVVGARLATYDRPSRVVRRTAGVALPLVFAGFAAYFFMAIYH